MRFENPSPAGSIDFALLAQRLTGTEGDRLCADAQRRLATWDDSEAHRQWAQILRFATPAEISAFVREDTPWRGAC